MKLENNEEAIKSKKAVSKIPPQLLNFEESYKAFSENVPLQLKTSNNVEYIETVFAFLAFFNKIEL